MVYLKIKRAHIYGFGRWVDYSIDLSRDSLVCVFGENESGKSTLQKFILFMFFGLPPKSRQFYRPKKSGKLGGRLTVFDNEIGEFTIERFDDVKNGTAICYGKNGKTYDEAWLINKLKGMTDRIYQSIFSFSAIDLIHIKKMKDEDLGEILLSIGLTGSNRVYEIEKKLDHQIGELFKPFGKVPTINKQLDLLDNLKKEMDKQLENERTYRTKKEQLEETLHEIDLLTKQLKKKKETLFLVEKKKQALPILEDYRYHQEQLGKIPVNLPFPENGLERLHDLKGKRLPLKSEWTVITSNIEHAFEKLKRIESDILDEDVIIEARERLQLKDSYIKKDSILKSLIEKKRVITTKITTKLDELNLGLSDNELQTLSFPFQTEKYWGQLRNQKEKMEIEKGQIQQEKNSIQKQRNYLYNQLYEHESYLLDDQHRMALEQRVERHKSNEYLETMMTDTARKRKEWQKERKAKEKNANGFLIGSLLLAISSGLIAHLLNISPLYYLGLFVTVIGIGQWGWRRQSFKQMERLLTFDITNTSLDDTITEQSRSEAEQLLEQHELNKQTITSIQSQLKSVEGQLISWEEKEAGLLKREQKLREDMEAEKRRYPFLNHVHVTYWPDMYYSMNQLLGLMREKNEVDMEYEKIKQEQHRDHELIFRFVTEVMRIQKLDNDLILNSGKHNVDVCIDFIEQFLNEQNDLKRLYAQTKELIEENTKRQVELEEQLNIYEQEMTALFKIAEVDTEEAFYKQAKAVEVKMSLEQKVQELSIQLSAMFSRSEIDVLAQEDFHNGSLEIEYESIQSRIEELEDFIDQKRQEMADLNAIIVSLESSEAYSSRMHHFNIEVEQLQKLARRWAVLKTAKEVLSETKRKYREKYLTKVVKETSRYFSQLTAGKYTEVIPPMNEDGFLVVSDEGIRFKVDELSQGTVDQLYISLRLAISQTMSQDLQLPFMIDDAFVHFDEIRTDRMIEIIKSIAQNQQVIFFTCKGQIRQHISDAHVIDLGQTSLIS